MSAVPCSTVMTIGYEGKSIDEFVSQLLRNGVEQLLDVRYNPISRKKGFSKKKLAAALDVSGIGYVHIRELGIPSAERKNLKTRKDYLRLIRRYEIQLLPGMDLFVRQAAELTRERQSAIMCFEGDAACCHRSPLAKQIAHHTGSDVVHI